MKKSFVVSIILLVSGFSFAQQNTWTKKLKFGGEKRTRAIAFSVGEYGYVGTGEDTAEMTHNDLWRYDPLTDIWTQQANMPGSTRRNATAVTIIDKGYVGLGADSSVASSGIILDDWWEYNPTSNSWIQKANYPGGFDYLNNPGSQGVYFATAFEAGGKGYVCCGKMGPDHYGADLWQYDPLLDQWTRMADFPGLDRFQLASFSVDGKGYVGMGEDHDLYRKDWWEYDPLTDTWTQKANLPGVERGGASTFTLGQRGFVVYGSDGGYKNELWEYNPFTNSWSIRANCPGGERKNGIAFSIGNRGYAGLGKGPNGKKRNFYEYAPLEPVSIHEFNIEVSIYPNPTSDVLKIDLSDEIEGVFATLINANGQIIIAPFQLLPQNQINLFEYASGTYFLLLGNENGEILRNEKIAKS